MLCACKMEIAAHSKNVLSTHIRDLAIQVKPYITSHVGPQNAAT